MVNACPTPQATIPNNLYNQQLGMQQASSVNPMGPPPSGRKKALLIGINYFGTQAELKGCINDVHRMQGMLCQRYGFMNSPDCMRILTDDQYGPNTPTRNNVLDACRWLVMGAMPGDVLFFHYSGHGAQQEDPTYAEEDGYDETICPVDFNSAGMVVDDEIFDAIVGPLQPGVKLTAVMDCCHSGTGLDLPFALEYGRWRQEDNPCHSAGDVILLSGCQDDQTASDGGGGYGRPMGAMTTALCNSLERSQFPLTIAQLEQELAGELARGGFEQIPNITSSQAFDPNRIFSPADGIIGNTNPQIGRQFRKQKHAKRKNLMGGGLGTMLAAGAAGFVLGAGAMAMMDGGIADGLMMGGADMAMGGVGMMGDVADAGMVGMFDGDGGDGGFFGGDGDD